MRTWIRRRSLRHGRLSEARDLRPIERIADRRPGSGNTNSVPSHIFDVSEICHGREDGLGCGVDEAGVVVDDVVRICGVAEGIELNGDTGAGLLLNDELRTDCQHGLAR